MKFGFRFGADRAHIEKTKQQFSLALTNKVVTGVDTELWALQGDGHYQQSGDFVTWGGETSLYGIGVIAADAANMRAASRQLYLQVLELTHGYTLQRLWNFIPNINTLAGELDHYMLFCQGRAEAFAQGEQPLAGCRFPAASALSTPGGLLWVIFFAEQSSVQTLENPLQTPAYNYPLRYGPTAPGFTRAALLHNGNDLVVSGTASIRRSESLHVGDACAQAELALDNVSMLVAHAGLGGDVFDAREQLVSARVYLKDVSLWSSVAPVVEKSLSTRMDSVRVLQAHICRPELLVEVEAHFSRN